MISCKEATRLVSESLDRRLPLDQRIGLRLHLLLCRFCSRYRRQLLFVRDAVKRCVDQAEGTGFLANLSLSEEARQEIKRSLAAASDR